MTQQRWFCAACSREWVHGGAGTLSARRVVGGPPRYEGRYWEPALGCPACQSQQIELKVYSAAFPGADFQTKAEDIPIGADVVERPIAEPSEACLTPYTRENLLLAMAGGGG